MSSVVPCCGNEKRRGAKAGQRSSPMHMGPISDCSLRGRWRSRPSRSGENRSRRPPPVSVAQRVSHQNTPRFPHHAVDPDRGVAREGDGLARAHNPRLPRGHRWHCAGRSSHNCRRAGQRDRTPRPGLRQETSTTLPPRGGTGHGVGSWQISVQERPELSRHRCGLSDGDWHHPTRNQPVSLATMAFSHPPWAVAGRLSDDDHCDRVSPIGVPVAFTWVMEGEMPAAAAAERLDMIERGFPGIETVHLVEHGLRRIVGVGAGRDVAAGQPPLLAIGIVGGRRAPRRHRWSPPDWR